MFFNRFFKIHVIGHKGRLEYIIKKYFSKLRITISSCTLCPQVWNKNRTGRIALRAKEVKFWPKVRKDLAECEVLGFFNPHTLKIQEPLSKDLTKSFSHIQHHATHPHPVPP